MIYAVKQNSTVFSAMLGKEGCGDKNNTYQGMDRRKRLIQVLWIDKNGGVSDCHEAAYDTSWHNYVIHELKTR